MKKILSLLFISLAFATALESFSDLFSCNGLCIDQATESAVKNIKLLSYNDILEKYDEVRIVDSSKLLKKLKNSKPIVIFIHGWLGAINAGGTDAMIRSFLEKNSFNVLQLNWNNIALGPYIYSSRSVERIGKIVAHELNNLVASGIDVGRLHIIGHSLGAHISGFIGKNVNFTIPRITGLDPAGPLWGDKNKRLNSTDAKFVDILHTDIGALGLNEDIGHVDFYANGGSNIQPGCLIGLDICSHNRANYYWAESITNNEAFIGRKCPSYSEFENNSCDSNPTEIMGYGTLNTAKGKFFFQTNKASPYGRGETGSKYIKFDSIIGSLLDKL